MKQTDVPIIKMRDRDYDPSLFVPISTGNDYLDEFISNRGGIMPSTITMVTGPAGSGKTTLMCDWLAHIQRNGRETLFVSSEMDEIDFAEYAERFPAFRDLWIYYVDIERDIDKDLEELFSMGFSVILIDSFKDLKEKIADQRGCAKNAAERLLINLMKKAKGGVELENETVYTSFLMIQQVLKSGDFAGSNSLKHLITAHLKLVKDEGGCTYITYDKNRRGGKGVRDETCKMYYTIETNGVEYNEKRRRLEDMSLDFIEKEKERKVAKDQKIEQMFDDNSYDSLEELLSEQSDDETEIDVETVKNHMQSNGGNLSQTHRQLHEAGILPEDMSRYKLQKFCDEHDISRKTYS